MLNTSEDTRINESIQTMYDFWTLTEILNLLFFSFCASVDVGRFTTLRAWDPPTPHLMVFPMKQRAYQSFITESEHSSWQGSGV